MSDAPTNPGDSSARSDLPKQNFGLENEDPHYHDEDLDIQNDDLPRKKVLGKGKPQSKLPPVRRRFYED